MQVSRPCIDLGGSGTVKYKLGKKKKKKKKKFCANFFFIKKFQKKTKKKKKKKKVGASFFFIKKVQNKTKQKKIPKRTPLANPRLHATGATPPRLKSSGKAVLLRARTARVCRTRARATAQWAQGAPGTATRAAGQAAAGTPRDPAQH
jgi:hypothetical protein